MYDLQKTLATLFAVTNVWPAMCDALEEEGKTEDEDLDNFEVVVLDTRPMDEKVEELANDLRLFIDIKKVKCTTEENKQKQQEALTIMAEQNKLLWPTYFLAVEKRLSMRDAAREILTNPDRDMGWSPDPWATPEDSADTAHASFKNYWQGNWGADPDKDGPEHKSTGVYGIYRYQDYMENRDEWFGHGILQWDLAHELKQLRAKYRYYQRQPNSAHILTHLAYMGKDRAECLELSRKSIKYMRATGRVYRATVKH